MVRADSAHRLDKALWFRHSGAVKATIDSVSWFWAVLVALVLRYEFDLSAIDFSGARLIALMAAVLALLMGYANGLYRRRWRLATFEEVIGVVGAVGAVTSVLFAFGLFAVDRPVPLSVPIIAGLLALFLSFASRYTARSLIQRQMRSQTSSDAQRLLVFGAGEAATQVITQMLRQPDGAFVPVGLLDDDPGKSRLTIRNIPVVGDRTVMAEAVSELKADAVLIAIPGAGATVIRDIAERARATGLDVLILPSLDELLNGGAVGTGDIRPLDVRDLLGRRQIETDLGAISDYVKGRRVLVTGAGGSIGSELCRQLTKFAPDELVMLDRDESALHSLQMSIEGRAMLESRNLVVCDIRDRDRLTEVFAEHRPQVVFHAAALKHLPLLEMHPTEGVKTNVLGTLNLLDVSALTVDTFVNISTDKAADPTSVLGWTKRLAERLTADIGSGRSGTYLSVRFGNVLGSRGSVLMAFQAQITAGGPVTVTHPDVTRYFMTVEEAVQLVIQAGAIGSTGDALVLDMGVPVKIVDVAKQLIEQTDQAIEIEFTGLRPGEKMHEVLHNSNETASSVHELISRTPVPTLSPDELGNLVQASSEHVVAELVRLCAVEGSNAMSASETTVFAGD